MKQFFTQKDLEHSLMMLGYSLEDTEYCWIIEPNGKKATGPGLVLPKKWAKDVDANGWRRLETALKDVINYQKKISTEPFKEFEEDNENDEFERVVDTLYPDEGLGTFSRIRKQIDGVTKDLNKEGITASKLDIAEAFIANMAECGSYDLQDMYDFTAALITRFKYYRDRKETK